jgi:hypothetical protein
VRLASCDRGISMNIAVHLPPAPRPLPVLSSSRIVSPAVALERRLRGPPANAYATVSILLLVASLAGCGKSSEQIERENGARQVAMQKALADSVAEEREKDRRMRDTAAQQANERIAHEAAAHEVEVARTAATAPVGPTPEQQQAERVNTLRRYTDKLMQTVNDPASAQVRKMELSPKQNGMCAEFNAKTRAGGFAGFKRVVVTDSRVTAEEPPMRETLTQFLLFQIAARDTGCFPDVENIRIL